MLVVAWCMARGGVRILGASGDSRLARERSVPYENRNDLQPRPTFVLGRISDKTECLHMDQYVLRAL